MASEEPNSNPRRRFIRRCSVLVTNVLFAMWCFGQLLRDSTWFTRLCFYVPSLFLMCSLVVLCAWHCGIKKHRAAVLAGAFACLPAYFVFFVENSFSATSPAAVGSADLRLVHWNVCSGRLGWDNVQGVLSSERADIYVFSEAPDEGSVREFSATLEGQVSVHTFGRMAVVAKGTIRNMRWLKKAKLKVQALTWEYAGNELSLLVVDIDSSPFNARGPHLRELHRLMEEHAPDLIVGDFNSPRRSQGLSSLPAGYQHAFHSAGTGVGYTWPVPFPMYSLDHCLHGPRVLPADYALRTTWFSDHRLQRFDFSVEAVGE